jgi:hypothetical protein
MTKFFCFLAWLGIFLAAPSGWAEYRVFNLVITNTKTNEIRTMVSTLDPIQYHYIYPVTADEVVSYTETWRCFGRTDWFTPYCPNPKAQSPAPPVNP